MQDIGTPYNNGTSMKTSRVNPSELHAGTRTRIITRMPRVNLITSRFTSLHEMFTIPIIVMGIRNYKWTMNPFKWFDEERMTIWKNPMTNMQG